MKTLPKLRRERVGKFVVWEDISEIGKICAKLVEASVIGKHLRPIGKLPREFWIIKVD